MRIITLGNGQQVRLPVYCRAWRETIALCRAGKGDTVMPHGLCGWWPVTADELLAEFRHGMHARINEQQPYYRRGCDAQACNQP